VYKRQHYHLSTTKPVIDCKNQHKHISLQSITGSAVVSSNNQVNKEKAMITIIKSIFTSNSFKEADIDTKNDYFDALTIYTKDDRDDAYIVIHTDVVDKHLRKKVDSIREHFKKLNKPKLYIVLAIDRGMKRSRRKRKILLNIMYREAFPINFVVDYNQKQLQMLHEICKFEYENSHKNLTLEDYSKFVDDNNYDLGEGLISRIFFAQPYLIIHHFDMSNISITDDITIDLDALHGKLCNAIQLGYKK
jgi:hypothetical protein